ncbi:putative pectinesterase inhibitor domain-containing protein [Helianthus annuus]|uniref:Pectinesterase inhibitor domain-containing protein n=2 Tax=Helianthus annuus TaxID=4232 RepID=A0A9K3HBP1_HELAN|nr:putative pectinesterase inhibitor domain-containing protein [Helianthus annuus]KAJ0476200.1 putative pectinesterase inhibitor domain-containing protein [Helianthus annuus]KAJ0480300.1 putative pectinesterase inhibitor domain-containing protein [Helianthus annuus]KAJ0497007.1 putative pectinesterase inhibitor domain-containing protein [Helianthus annuus]KAJ0663038.1 putative pectinesterase inhibitor domain-containing protein [Helianthus annuus]
MESRNTNFLQFLKMKISSPLTILFLLFLLQQTLLSAMADLQLIKNTCKGTPSSSLCLKILLADPKSQNADLTGLALIGVDAINNKGLEILKQIVALKESRPELGPVLDHCAEVYLAVVDADVLSSRDALRTGMAKFAEQGMADSAVEAQVCEGSFGEHGHTSPMLGSNNAMIDVANVVRAIVHILLYG